MTKVLVTESHLNDIAEAIRYKNGGSDTYTPGEMAAAVRAIAPRLQEKTADRNGEVAPDDGYDGLSRVTVAVDMSAGVYAGATPPDAALGLDGEFYLQSVTGGSLASDGACYIATGLCPTAMHTVEVEAATVSNTAGWQTIYGTRNVAQARFTLRFYDGVSGNLGAHLSESPSATFKNLDLNVTKADMLNTFYRFRHNQAMFVNGSAVGNFGVGVSNTTRFPLEFYLFALNDAYATDFGPVAIKYWKAWDGYGKLEMCLVATRDGSGTPCMYDMIGDRYLYNSGSGAFSFDESAAHTVEVLWRKVNGAWEVFK